MIIGRGASIYGTRHATLTQAFGPEARGSACSAQIVVSDEPVEYPYVTRPDILVVMSQDAYNLFAPDMADNAILLYESDLVEPRNLRPGITAHGIPSTKIAEELRRRMVANIVMVGFFGAMVDLVPADALRKSVADSVPPGTEALNLQAFDQGFAYGSECRAGTVGARP
jgi:2-oxoglutarate ferredoxin oxidoreductase subunit gamma